MWIIYIFITYKYSQDVLLEVEWMAWELVCEAATVAKLPALVVAMWLLVELGELWLGVMGMVLLGVLLDNKFDFMVAVLPVVGMLACEFNNGLTAVGFTGWNWNIQ